jgi:ornithine carbamoyltransferase
MHVNPHANCIYRRSITIRRLSDLMRPGRSSDQYRRDLADTGRVLSGSLDALVIRTNGPLEEMRALSSQERMAVINAMTENEHPPQAIADLATMHESLGRLQGVHVLYVGEGNNSAAALTLAISMIPRMHLTLISPEGYGLPSIVIEAANEFARTTKAVIECHHDAGNLPRNVDVVYTTRWQTMGVPNRIVAGRKNTGPTALQTD